MSRADPKGLTAGLTADATLSRLETFSRPAPEPVEDLIRSIREEY